MKTNNEQINKELKRIRFESSIKAAILTGIVTLAAYDICVYFQAI